MILDKIKANCVAIEGDVELTTAEESSPESDEDFRERVSSDDNEIRPRHAQSFCGYPTSVKFLRACRVLP